MAPAVAAAWRLRHCVGAGLCHVAAGRWRQRRGCRLAVSCTTRTDTHKHTHTHTHEGDGAPSAARLAHAGMHPARRPAPHASQRDHRGRADRVRIGGAGAGRRGGDVGPRPSLSPSASRLLRMAERRGVRTGPGGVLAPTRRCTSCVGGRAARLCLLGAAAAPLGDVRRQAAVAASRLPRGARLRHATRGRRDGSSRRATRWPRDQSDATNATLGGRRLKAFIIFIAAGSLDVLGRTHQYSGPGAGGRRSTALNTGARP
jgi:hypothetical protein